MGEDEARFRAPGQSDVDVFVGRRVQEAARLNLERCEALLPFPKPNLFARVPIWQAGLALHGVLETNLESVLGARFEQSVLDSGKWFESLGWRFQMGTNGRGNCLLKNIAQRYQTIVAERSLMKRL